MKKLFSYVKKQKTIKSLQEFYQDRNKILIKRTGGGFGDILMQRMLFEDLCLQYPQLEFYWTCPRNYLSMTEKHPYVTSLAIEEINQNKYGAVYNTTTACREHEIKHLKNNTSHRSDIWANHIGVKLKHHNMHLTIESEILKQCQWQVNSINTNKKPTIFFNPYSAKNSENSSKSLTTNQIIELCEELKKQGFFIYNCDDANSEIFKQLNVKQFVNVNHKFWIGLIKAADYVISVDTASFHIAGGLKKPLVGIFTHTNGQVYGKYYDFVLVQKPIKENWDCGPCYNCCMCPKSTSPQKPCLTELTVQDILEGFYELLKKCNFSENNLKNNQSGSSV